MATDDLDRLIDAYRTVRRPPADVLATIHRTIRQPEPQVVPTAAPRNPWLVFGTVAGIGLAAMLVLRCAMTPTDTRVGQRGAHEQAAYGATTAPADSAARAGAVPGADPQRSPGDPVTMPPAVPSSPDRDGSGPAASPNTSPILGADPTPAPAAAPATKAPARRSTPTARPSAPPSSDPADAPAVDELAALRLLTRAERALVTDPTAALRLLDQHQQRHRQSALATEREALRVLALCAAGQLELGKRRRRAFLAANPGSAYATRLRAACADTE